MVQWKPLIQVKQEKEMPYVESKVKIKVSRSWDKSKEQISLIISPANVALSFCHVRRMYPGPAAANGALLSQIK